MTKTCMLFDLKMIHVEILYIQKDILNERTDFYVNIPNCYGNPDA